MITPADADKFFERFDFGDCRGIYVFGIRNRGLTPWYVGKTARTFQAEAFTDHKRNKYNEVLSNVGHGTPIMHLLLAPPSRGQFNTNALHELEEFLIDAAFQVNPGIKNIQGVRKEPSWAIQGVRHHTKPGRQSEDEMEFARLFDF